MVVPRLATFRKSPLGRHPRLLVRKVLERARGAPTFTFAQPPATLSVAYPEGLAEALRAWGDRCGPVAEAYPFERIFHRDFSRSELMTACAGTLPRSDGLEGDIKRVWEFSRAYAAALNAIPCKDADARDQCAKDNAEFLLAWQAANADPDGTNWVCAMEVAIRAVNWICADALLEGRLSSALPPGAWAAWLWNHGRAIETRLETRIKASNHYLADVMGLLFIGCVLRGVPEAPRWSKFAHRELEQATLAQTFADGGLNERSLPYHALVTEMVLLSLLVTTSPPSPRLLERVNRMRDILVAGCSASGDMFCLGDDDGGRILPLDFVVPMGRAEVLAHLGDIAAGPRSAEPVGNVYPSSGWWFGRAGDFAAALDFGPTDHPHAHNDTLGLCLDWRGHAVVVDPGSYLYTPDPEARNRFRATASHSTVQADGLEQSPLPPPDTEHVFVMPGRAAGALVDHADRRGAELLLRDMSPGGPGRSHRRRVVLAVGQATVEDTVTGSGCAELVWRFLVHPTIKVTPCAEGFRLEVPGAGTLNLACRGASPEMSAEPAGFAPFYGHLQSTTCATACARLELPVTVCWTFVPS